MGLYYGYGIYHNTITTNHKLQCDNKDNIYWILLYIISFYITESADKPARDLHKIVLEQKLREGEETTSSNNLSKRLHEVIGRLN